MSTIVDQVSSVVASSEEWREVDDARVVVQPEGSTILPGHGQAWIAISRVFQWPVRSERPEGVGISGLTMSENCSRAYDILLVVPAESDIGQVAVRERTITIRRAHGDHLGAIVAIRAPGWPVSPA